GYSLEHLLPENGFDAASFMAGTEGTLAVTLGAQVTLVPAPPVRHLLVLGYGSMAEAADNVPGLLPHLPTACEGLDSRIVEVVRARKGRSAVPELPAGSGWLFVEFGGEGDGEVAAAANRASRDAGTDSYRLVRVPEEQAALWQIREEGA